LARTTVAAQNEIAADSSWLSNNVGRARRFRRGDREERVAQLGVTLRDGIVHLSSFITDERLRRAAIQ
jgi:hypothetical protein